MMKTTMELEALKPEYLVAKIDTDQARKRLRSAWNRFKGMGSVNERHANEVAEKSRTGNALITNGVAQRQGGGYGREVVYTRCSCDGFETECHHDPRTPPYSDTDLKDAEAGIAKAETKLAAAETRLASIEPSFDCLAAAREAGALYVWWPMDRNRDPRKYRWRGQPVSDADVVASGPHELRRMLNAGAIVEVT